MNIYLAMKIICTFRKYITFIIDSLIISINRLSYDWKENIFTIPYFDKIEVNIYPSINQLLLFVFSPGW